MTPRARNARDDRAASEVVAVALLIGLVVLGVTTVLLIGSPQLGKAQSSMEVGQAEQALTQFDSDAVRVAAGGTTSQRTDLGLRANEGTLDVENDSGRITVEYVNVSNNATTTTLMNESLGGVVYENGDTTVSYEGGGVWRSDGSGSVMVSPPEITLRDKTLTMQVIRTRGGSVYSEVQVVRLDARERYPNAAAGLDNKLSPSKVRITIQSRYYKAWGAYFEEETNAIVRYDDAAQEMTVVFLALPENFAPGAGVIATSGPGELRLDANGAYIDSYNSIEGPYSVSQSDNGTVEAAGDVIMDGSADIKGDVKSGGDIELSGGAEIDGDAIANDSISVGGSSSITGETRTGPTTVYRPPINQLIEDKTDTIRNTNDNDATPVIRNERLDIAGEEATLGPGEYYLKDLNLQGEDLVLNTTDGNVTIAVENWMKLEKVGNDNSHIRVEGNGTVRVFVASNEKTTIQVPRGGNRDVHFFVERGGGIFVDGQESPRFQVYGPDNFQGAVGGSNAEQPNVTATIYAPAGDTGTGEFLHKKGDIYGAVATGTLTVGEDGRIHFDRALLDANLPLARSVPRLEYLYLTEYEVEVNSS